MKEQLPRLIIHAASIAKISRPFVEIVTENTKTYADQVAVGTKKWPQNIQISDDTQASLTKEFANQLKNFPASETKDFQESIIKYKKDGQILLLEDIPLQRSKVPENFQALDPKTYEDTKVRTNLNIFAGFLGITGLHFFFKKNELRIRAMSPQKTAHLLSFDTTKEIKFHTDGAHAPNGHIPDHTALLCINGDKDISTDFLNADLLFYQLSTKHQEVLLKEDFYTVFEGQYGNIMSAPFAIFTNNTNGNINIRYTEMGMCFKNTYAEEAFNELKNIVKNSHQMAHKISLEPGNLCIFNNKEVMHYRAPAPEEKAPTEKETFTRFVLRSALMDPREEVMGR